MNKYIFLLSITICCLCCTCKKTNSNKDNDVFYYKDASVICLHKVSDEIDSDFIKLVIESPYMQKLMHDNSNGTTVDTITISTANQYLFPLPPLNEQNEIIKNVHRMRKCIDSIEANLI